MFSKTLYKRDQSQRIREWTIEVEGNAYRTISGLIDGEKVTSEWSYCFGKNQGRANATSDEEQAIRVAETLIRIRREQGSYDTIEDAGKGKAFFQPMLASKWDNHRDKITVNEEHPIYVQRKLDGCVSGETLIATEIGDISIKDIVEKGIGTFAYSYNPVSRKQELKPIIGRFKNIPDIQEKDYIWYKITLSDGKELKVTGNHKIYLPKLKCWRRVDELTEGDFVLNQK